MSNTYKLLIIIAFSIFLAFIYFYSPFTTYLDINVIKSYIAAIPKDTTTVCALLVFFVFGSLCFVSVPLMVVTVNLIFSWWQALGISCIGLLLGSTCAYLLGRLLSIEFKKSSSSNALKLIKQKLNTDTLLAVTLIRISPLPPYSMSGFMLGSLKVNYPKYLFGSLLGVMPITLFSLLMSEFVIIHILN